MSADRDVTPLMVLALEALCDTLHIDPDELPAGAKGVLLRYGLACHAKGRDAGVAEAHTADTLPPPKRISTNKRFPAVPPHPTTVIQYDDEKTPITNLPDGVLEKSKRDKNRG